MSHTHRFLVCGPPKNFSDLYFRISIFKNLKASFVVHPKCPVVFVQFLKPTKLFGSVKKLLVNFGNY
jgi:hypothetical protein